MLHRGSACASGAVRHFHVLFDHRQVALFSGVLAGGLGWPATAPAGGGAPAAAAAGELIAAGEVGGQGLNCVRLVRK